MNTFELNKIFGAFLFAGLVAMTAWLISLAAFGKFEHSEHEHVAHYQVAGLETEVVSHGPQSAENTVKEQLPISTLLANADITKGQKTFKKCGACHTPDEGGKNKIGPNLWNIVNRPIASIDGFKYSTAMAAMEGRWSFELLNEFLNNPKETVPGTKMAFKGISKDANRANLIAFLRSLSQTPAELSK